MSPSAMLVLPFSTTVAAVSVGSVELGTLAVAGLMVGAGAWCAGIALLLFPRGERHWPASTVPAVAEPLRRHGHEDLIDLLLEGRASDSSDRLWETDDQLRLRGDLFLPQTEGVQPPTGVALTQIVVVSSDGADALLGALARREDFRDAVVQLSGSDGGWWRLSGRPVFDAFGRFVGYRGIASDVTALREAQEQIAHLATHDALTGLANRQSFQAHATRACAAAATRPVALLLLDLDGFKQVNDTLGHAVGDELLAAVALALTHCAPPGAIVARLGGDEFAILAETAPPAAEAVAQAVCRAVAMPFTVGEHRIRIGVSVGIAFAPADATNARDLARRADLALYKAKAAGRGVHVSYQEAFEREIEERLRLEADIRRAIDRGEFTLHYQPLLDVAEGRVDACEALMRWHSPERGEVSPGIFIPAAERSDLIVAIGRFALTRACRDAAAWPLPARVAVNISPQHLRSAEFKADVASALKNSGLPPSRLEIEITEGVFLDTSRASVDALTWLRERGIKVALDDFGTGFSSLNYLVDFPVDKIKIDRAFIAGFLERRQSRAVVDAILMLARELNIRVVAEGVETVDQALALKLRRCDDLQGFLISRPQPPEEVARLLLELPERLRGSAPALLESSLAAALALKRSA